MFKLISSLIFLTVYLLFFNLNYVFSQMSLQWTKQFNGDGGYNYNDRTRGAVEDSQGNLIITGCSYDNNGYSNFYVTVKYDSNGNILWTARMDTSSNYGTPYGITTDINDNIYITGGYTNTYSQKFTILKYSANGELKWIKNEDTLSSPYGNCGKSIVTDIYGNVYVAGFCSTQGGFYDFLTIKYDSNGVKKWSSVYNHTSNNSDKPKKIILDNQNNVYVVGSTMNGGGYIATTLKYNNSGNLVWVALYDETVNLDFINDIAVNENGNVYVTGYSNINYAQSDYNFFTIKYDINGDSIWVRRFNGPGVGNNNSVDIPYSLNLDNNMNVIVSGRSMEIDGDNDVRIIKYAPDGSEIWNNNFDFNSHSDDFVYSMKLDNQNNIYLAGITNQDYLLLKCNSDGNLIWNNSYNGIDNGPYMSTFLNLDQFGNPLLTGSRNNGKTSEDYLALKTDTTGSLHWERSFSSPALSNDISNSLAADNNGNIYVTGKTESLNNKIDLITLKYNSIGNLVWKKNYNEVNSIFNEGKDIAVDRYGSSYVTGYTTTPEQHKVLLTLKYDSSGVLSWSSMYSGIVENTTIPNKIILDNNGNVYVCGLTLVSGHGYDLLVVKYNALNGDTLWIRTYNNAFNGNEEGIDINIDAENNILIAGYTTVSLNYTDYLITKFDENGNLIWIRTYDKLQSDIAYSVKSDKYNSVYITGRTHQVTSNPPFNYTTTSYSATLKFDENGNLKWTSIDGEICYTCPSENSAYDLTMDDQFNVYITGEKTGKFKTIKYDSLGNMMWIKLYATNYANNRSTNIITDNQSNIFVTGRSFSSQYNIDLTTIKYNNVTGNQEWINNYSNNDSRDGITSNMIIDSLSSIFITGYLSSNSTGYDIVTLKYSNSSIGINSNNSVIEDYSLSQNYPNPFNPTTNLEFGISELGFVSLKIYNALGKEVATIVNEVLAPGKYNYQFSTADYQLASGIYFYKLEAGGFVETKSMILLK